MSSQTAISYGQNPPVIIDPDDFVRKINNPYFPLKPGTTYFYENSDKSETIEFEVTRKTINILGVTCTVVLDTVRDENGQLIEKTFDYFAQDRKGNVWYFGEHSKNFENGKFVDTEGSWLAGVDGAAPGIIMKAHPRVGDRYNQENAPGIAEDMGKVLKLDDSVTVPYGTFENHVLRTKDFTPLEPGVFEHKFYAKGIGTVFVVNPATGEFEHLVKMEVAGTGGDDKLSGRAGPDDLLGRSGNDHLSGRSGDDLLVGSRGNDWLSAGSGDDTAKGGPGRDTLLGSSGDDTLQGGRGNDILCGGRGADDLHGGRGADQFVFKALTDSPTLAAGDFIRDFTHADRIDVSAIDAVAGMSGNQSFNFIGLGAFTGAPGELRFTLDDQAGTANDRTVVEADVDGDAAADLQFALRGLVNLVDNDFIL